MNKKELEKKKDQKKREKLKRKEERKANGGSKSFEDMIAYVDEFGMITDTPPDPSKKKAEVELESIAVSSPKQEEMEKEPMKGRVEHFNEEKGYGFIKDMASVNKYFFHISNAPEDIKEGNIVTFDLEKGQRGMNAVRIEHAK